MAFISSDDMAMAQQKQQIGEPRTRSQAETPPIEDDAKKRGEKRKKRERERDRERARESAGVGEGDPVGGVKE